MLPQRGVPSRMPLGQPSKSFLSPKGVLGLPMARPGVPNKPVAGPVKEFMPLSRRVSEGGVDIKALKWSLKSQKAKIFEKYKIKGKEVDDFIKNIDKFKFNTFISRREAGKLEKVLGARSMWSRNTKERVESKKWSKIFRDPKIFKK